MGRGAAVVLAGVLASGCSGRPLALPDPAGVSTSDHGVPALDLASAPDLAMTDFARADLANPDLSQPDLLSPDLAMPPHACNADWVDCDSVPENGCECRATSCVAGVCRKLAFVTSKTYDANLGGLTGADQKCQTLADTADLGGRYLAWLCDYTGSPATRFVRSSVPYVRVDGTVIANDWSSLANGSLFTGSIAAPIDKTESGGPAPRQFDGFMWPVVWTNCIADGTRFDDMTGGSADCANWTSNSYQYLAIWGNAEEMSRLWTYNWETGCGNGLAALFCFEQ